MCTLANSEDTDEMPHNTVFHQGHLLFAKKRKKYNFISKIKTCEPLGANYIFYLNFIKSLENCLITNCVWFKISSFISSFLILFVTSS